MIKRIRRRAWLIVAGVVLGVVGFSWWGYYVGSGRILERAEALGMLIDPPDWFRDEEIDIRASSYSDRELRIAEPRGVGQSTDGEETRRGTASDHRGV